MVLEYKPGRTNQINESDSHLPSGDKDYKVDVPQDLPGRENQSLFPMRYPIYDVICYPTGLFSLYLLIKASFLLSFEKSRANRERWELKKNASIYFPVQLLIGCLTECPPFTGSLLLG